MRASRPGGAAGLAAALAVLLAAGCTVVVRPADPSIRVERAAPALPPITVVPALAPIAGSPVAYVANWHEDVFVFESRWYRPYGGLWYRAPSAAGPWVAVSRARVPRPVLSVPATYRAQAAPRPVLAPPPPAPRTTAQQQAVQQQVVQQTIIVQQAAPTVVVQAPAAPAAPAAQPVFQQPAAQPALQQPAAPAAQAVATASLPARAEPIALPRSPARAEPMATPGSPARPEPIAPPSSPARPEPIAPLGPPAHGARAQGKTPGRVTVTPALRLIEGSPVAYVENWPEALFRLEGQWYRQVDGVWYRSPDVAGDWTEVARGDLPKAIVEVPRDYRGAGRGGQGHGAPGKNKKKG